MEMNGCDEHLQTIPAQCMRKRNPESAAELCALRDEYPARANLRRFAADTKRNNAHPE